MSSHQFEREQHIDPTANSFFPLETVVCDRDDKSSPSVSSRTEMRHERSSVLQRPDETSSGVGGFRQSSGANLRQFSRCPISEDRTSAVLCMNGRRFDCRLVELSIGGFGVVVVGQPNFPTGTVGNLRAPGLNYVVSVSRKETRPGGMYIGLRQIEEIIEAQCLPGDASSIVGYLIAGVAGMIIASASYFFMYGT